MVKLDLQLEVIEWGWECQIIMLVFILRFSRCIFFFFIFILILFIFLAVLGLCCCVRVFLQLRRAGATLRCVARASHCSGFSCCGVWALGTRASVVVAHGLSSWGSRALERRLSSCAARAQLPHGMWDLPRPGLKPVSPALAGGFLTTAPPGKPLDVFSYLFSRQRPSAWGYIDHSVDYS